MNLLDVIQRKATHINTLAELNSRLSSGKQLRIKYGIDPNNPKMHLGHTVPLRLLREFQNAGHKAIIILGDFTAALGDPTGRDHVREGTKLEEARKNSVKYIAQLRKVIDTDHRVCEIHYNSDWLEKLTTLDWLQRMKHWTIQQITDRDDFKNRIAKGDGVHLSEIMYTLFQGEDSVRIKADVELGGSEQLFTLMVGREMQKQAGQEGQICITLPILRGTDGQKRMGKSLGNFVAIDEEPFEMLSKVMSIPDELMTEWVNLLTDGICTTSTFQNPMLNKQLLAFEIVKWLHDANSAKFAAEKWHRQFSLKEVPQDIVEKTMDRGNLIRVVRDFGFATSNNMARRLIEQGAVSVNEQKIVDPNWSWDGSEIIVKCGRKFGKALGAKL